MEIPTEAQLLDLELARAPRVGRADEGVIFGTREIVDKVRIKLKLSGEILRIERELRLAAVPVEPGEIREGEGIRYRACSGLIIPQREPRRHERKDRNQRKRFCFH